MRKIHELKILFQYAEMVRVGIKLFELRFNDRDYSIGDLIRFKVIDHQGFLMVAFEKTLYEIVCVVDYPCALKDGFVALGIRKYSEDASL